MVSWNDGETSEDSTLNMCSSCDSIIKLPATMHDPNFNGTDADVNVLCEHGKPTDRFVTFEGMHTSRRFLGLVGFFLYLGGKKGAAAAVIDHLVDVADVLLVVIVGALEVPAASIESLLVAIAGVLLSLLVGSLEVPAAVVEALLAGAVGGVVASAPTDEVATITLLVGAAIEEDAPIDVVPSCVVFD
ncbi:hypothetical protein ZWY2020_011941 [Hordeum vulgare]|nr:hypothetical protein ZWY2020_011941 [Hordeum vulgare]